MIKVFVENDRVILDLGSRRTDVLLTCLQADSLVQYLKAGAAGAETAPPTLIKGEGWGAQVVSYDGMVAIRFRGPGFAGFSRVPLTAKGARLLADEVEFKKQQAARKMRFNFVNSNPLVNLRET